MSDRPRELLEAPALSPLEKQLRITKPAGPTTKPSIGAVPRSAVFDRLQAFMPSMAAANQALAQQAQAGQDAATLDIEHIEDDYEGPVIEMDLACGVLDLKDEAAVAAAQRDIASGLPVQLPDGRGTTTTTSGSGGASSSDDDSSDSDESDGAVWQESAAARGVATEASTAGAGGGGGTSSVGGVGTRQASAEREGGPHSGEHGASRMEEDGEAEGSVPKRRKVKSKRQAGKKLIEELPPRH